MAKESNDKPQGEKKYFYRRCPTCGVKLHVAAYRCWKCGNQANYNEDTRQWQDMIYFSNNQNDAIYGRVFNDHERCVSCFNTQKGRHCKYAICFGTGKGSCGICDRFENVRFMCCQNVQKQERSVKLI